MPFCVKDDGPSRARSTRRDEVCRHRDPHLQRAGEKQAAGGRRAAAPMRSQQRGKAQSPDRVTVEVQNRNFYRCLHLRGLQHPSRTSIGEALFSTVAVLSLANEACSGSPSHTVVSAEGQNRGQRPPAARKRTTSGWPRSRANSVLRLHRYTFARLAASRRLPLYRYIVQMAQA